MRPPQTRPASTGTNQAQTGTQTDSSVGRVLMVAGAGFEPATFKVMSEMVNMFDYFSSSNKNYIFSNIYNAIVFN